MCLRFLVKFLFIGLVVAADECDLPSTLVDEIRGYQDVVDQIIEAVVDGEYSGRFWNDLADFVDTYGNRIVGSQNLEDAIDNVLDRMAAIGLTTSSDPVTVPQWIRGNESAEILAPRNRKLTILGLGSSPGTGPDGITAEVLMVKDFNELSTRASEVPGKIVFYNAEYVSYGQTQPYRTRGPSEASKLGAVATLIRSITPFSINSPHTGNTHFDDGVTPIPAAALSLEDANRISRLINLGKTVQVNLKMEAKFGEDKISRNAYGDLVGQSIPEEFVTLSGHIDSWDVGQGAMDDAGGAFLAMNSLWLIKTLSLPTPKRTLRAIFWTGEEIGLAGAEAYLNAHADELKNWSMAFESDVGVFEPLGIQFAGNEDATCIIREIMTMFDTINATQVLNTSTAGSDIDTFQPLGVPLAEPLMVPNNYFWFHHSDGDSMNVLRSEDLDKNLAIAAGVSYILADLSIKLPRNNQTARDLLT